MHNGYLVVEGEKMSKSLGNFFTVRDLLDEGVAGETIRLAMFAAHYRQPLDWREDGVAQAKDALDRFYLALRNASDVEAADAEPDGVLAALADDLNTPLAISEIHELVTALNKSEGADKARLKGQVLRAGALPGRSGPGSGGMAQRRVRGRRAQRRGDRPVDRKTRRGPQGEGLRRG